MSGCTTVGDFVYSEELFLLQSLAEDTSVPSWKHYGRFRDTSGTSYKNTRAVGVDRAEEKMIRSRVV